MDTYANICEKLRLGQRVEIHLSDTLDIILAWAAHVPNSQGVCITGCNPYLVSLVFPDTPNFKNLRLTFRSLVVPRDLEELETALKRGQYLWKSKTSRHFQYWMFYISGQYSWPFNTFGVEEKFKIMDDDANRTIYGINNE